MLPGMAMDGCTGEKHYRSDGASDLYRDCTLHAGSLADLSRCGRTIQAGPPYGSVRSLEEETVFPSDCG